MSWNLRTVPRSREDIRWPSDEGGAPSSRLEAVVAGSDDRFEGRVRPEPSGRFATVLPPERKLSRCRRGSLSGFVQIVLDAGLYFQCLEEPPNDRIARARRPLEALSIENADTAMRVAD